MKKTISVIFGTRPEAIKLAPVITALKTDADVHLNICVTGQHKEMLNQVLEIFDIHPDVNLAVMQPNQSLNTLTARLLTGIDGYLDLVHPDLVLAQGDTTSVFVAALASFHRKIPFGHVEAGLRTYNLSQPWPEEANRVLTTRISTMHFAPTAHASDTLRKEGVSADTIFQTGNTVIDALRHVESLLPKHMPEIEESLPPAVFDEKNRVVLITGHRRENLDGGIKRVCQAIRILAEQFPDTQFVYPVHLNPSVQKTVLDELGSVPQGNVHLIKPLSYMPLVWLMRRSTFVITDSGGIQEEAPSFGKPVLVTREVTERPEGVASGNAVLVGTDAGVIVDLGTKLLTDTQFYDSMAHAVNPYGDGTAAEQIVKICKKYLEII